MRWEDEVTRAGAWRSHQGPGRWRYLGRATRQRPVLLPLSGSRSMACSTIVVASAV